MTYVRPIAMTDAARPAGALSLAGGWCWFDRVEFLDRNDGPRLGGLGDLTEAQRQSLSAPRAGLAGLSMDRPRLMGILNVTPDSFSDGGRFLALDAGLAQAKAMAAHADILDIGGESTRPGAAEVSETDEIGRTIPVISALRAAGVDTVMSIDTRKAAVASAALGAGAQIVNDVSALSFDPAMAGVLAQSGAPVVLMHAKGTPKTMQIDPNYDNVLLDVYDFLEEKVNSAVASGVARSAIALDPGIGFGKTVAHNLALVRGLSLLHGLGCPILFGASRKRMIGELSAGAAPQDRAPGSIALALAAVAQGVQIVRVHDVTETRQALALWSAVELGVA